MKSTISENTTWLLSSGSKIEIKKVKSEVITWIAEVDEYKWEQKKQRMQDEYSAGNANDREEEVIICAQSNCLRQLCLIFYSFDYLA